MSERYENQGRLQEYSLEAKRLELSIRGLIQTLRSEVSPHKEIDEMDPAMIHEQAFELSQKIEQHKGLSKKIALLKRDLGLR